MESDNNKIPPVIPGIFTLPPYDQAPPKLLGGFCSTCNRYYFPRRKYCQQCLETVEECDLGSEGIIYSFTVVRKKPPLGLPEPYVVGYIDLSESGLRICCLLDHNAIDQIRIGLPVKLAVGIIGHNVSGATCLRPYFSPRTEEKDIRG